jgi:hypothetical protein
MARRRIAGSRILITGASQGIGAALAEEAARRGARVLPAARSAELLEQLTQRASIPIRMELSLERRLAQAVVFCAAAVLSGSVSRGQARITMADIVKHWDEQQAAVESARFEWVEEITRTRGSTSLAPGPSGEVVPPRDYTYSSPNLLAFDRTAILRRYNSRHWVDSGFRDWENSMCFDGQYFKGFDPTSWRTQHPGGGIMREDHFKDQAVMHLRPILMAYRATDAKMGPYEGLPFKLTGQSAQIRGRNCLEVQAQTRDKGLLWVDPGRDFVAMRFETRVGARVLWRADVEDYELRENHVWVPTVWAISEYHSDGTTQMSSRAKVTAAAINPRLSRSDLDIEYPPGSVVMDQTRNVTFVQKEGGKRRDLAPAELQLSYEELLALSAPSPSKRLWKWPVVTAGLALLFTGLILAIRWRRRRARPGA